MYMYMHGHTARARTFIKRSVFGCHGVVGTCKKSKKLLVSIVFMLLKEIN